MAGSNMAPSSTGSSVAPSSNHPDSPTLASPPPPPLPPSPMAMRLNRTWMVDCPPAKMSVVGGKLVPTVQSTLSLGGRLLFRRKPCRLSIEIHGPDTNPTDNANDTDTDTDVKRDAASAASSLAGRRRDLLVRDTLTMSRAIELSKELMDDDRILVRIFKPRKGPRWAGFARDPDDSSSSSSDSSDSDNDRSDDSGAEDDHGWVEYRKYGVDEIVNVEWTGRHKTIFEATMGLGTSQERREIHFQNEEQAKQFWTEITNLKALVKERAQTRLQAFQQWQRQTEEHMRHMSGLLNGSSGDRSIIGKEMTAESEIQLLIEIVSATDLPVSDRLKQSSDPYIIVYLGHEEIHRTAHISKTLNPIWTIATGSLCLLSTSAQEFFLASAGLTFVLKDKDTIISNDVLGNVSVSHSTLLRLTGNERLALPFNLETNYKAKPSRKRRLGGSEADPNVLFPPTLYIRARRATEDDRTFMKQVLAVHKKKSLGLYANQTFVGPHADRVNRLKRESKMVDGIRKHRVKPHPDPNRPEQVTKWMSSEDLVAEIMKPTQAWIEAGSGSLGKLYLEILKCDGLPNMDTGINGKTDAFCCIIYEDAIVNTDVINDTTNPRWVPWCHRGFLFRMAHPSSQILIGVFDYDSEKNVAFNSHDAIGRISIDITNFRRDTEYVLTYDLYRSVLDNERQTYGTLTVRLRLEYDSFREFVKGSLELPPINYMNLPQKNAFKTSYFVVHGEENLQRFDMEAINAYRSELEDYLIILHYIRRAAFTIFLWRGHKEIRLGKYKVLLPIHSAVAFWMGITLIENFNWAPSYFLFSIAWLLLATNEMRLKNPSPWHGPLNYRQLWHAVLANQAPPVIIDAHENEAAIRAYEKERKERQDDERKKAQEARERIERIDALFSEERKSAAEAAQEDNSTKMRGPPTLNPWARVLLPIQRILGQVCKALRIASSIVLWDESIYAFIIVNSCLLLGFVFTWVPWHFVVRWTLRIVIWIFLGPWMKLFDIFYVKKRMTKGEDETAMFRKALEERIKRSTVAREAIEDIMKMRALKRFMFGRFVIRIPQLKEYRYPDVPRAESYARPVASPPLVVVERRSHGQTLVGKMIPTWGDALDATKSKKVKKRNTKEAYQTLKETKTVEEGTQNLEGHAALVDEEGAEQGDS